MRSVGPRSHLIIRSLETGSPSSPGGSPSLSSPSYVDKHDAECDTLTQKSPKIDLFRGSTTRRSFTRSEGTTLPCIENTSPRAIGREDSSSIDIKREGTVSQSEEGDTTSARSSPDGEESVESDSSETHTNYEEESQSSEEGSSEAEDFPSETAAPGIDTLFNFDSRLFRYFFPLLKPAFGCVITVEM